MSDSDVDGSIRLTPSLLRAIEDHKYLRSCESCRQVSLAQAAEEFRVRHEDRWRAAKLRADNARQLEEMQRHLWIESEKAGYDVGKTVACTEWVSRHAREWRRKRESLTGNDFQVLTITVQPGCHLDQRHSQVILERLAELSCDVFLSQEGLTEPDFLLRPEPDSPEQPFIHTQAERADALSRLDLRPGSRLFVVAYGREAPKALEALLSASQALVAAAL